MLNKFVLLTVLIAPWFTLFFVKKENIIRFMPAAILTSLIMITYNVVAYNQKHWVIHETLIPWLKPVFVSGVFGIFPVITLWVFHYAYGKFWKYLVTNIIIDFMFAVFPIHYLFHNVLGIYELINITPWGRFILFVFFSIVIYGYYKWQEDRFHSNPKGT